MRKKSANAGGGGGDDDKVCTENFQFIIILLIKFKVCRAQQKTNENKRDGDFAKTAAGN